MVELLLDNNIRDLLFIPMILMIFLLGFLKNYLFQLYAPMNPIIAKKRKTISACELKLEEREEENFFENAIIKARDAEPSYDSIATRATTLMANAHLLEKKSYLIRKAIYLDAEKGLFNKIKPTVNMGQMLNPATMMDSMMQGMYNSVYFMVILGGFGMLFSGFIIAKTPFALTSNFKPMLQQGMNNVFLDVSYVSTMSLYEYYTGCFC